MTEQQPFGSPQRQSLIGIIILFADTFQKLIRASWALWGILILKANTSQLFLISTSALAIIITLIIISYLKYRNFKFYIDYHASEFVVLSGILSKKKLSIGLDRIQQVNINQTIIQKFMNIYSLEIDTSGGKGKEVSIKAIDQKSALILKDLLSNPAISPLSESDKNIPETSQDQAFIRIGTDSLIKLGMTSNYGKSLGILFLFFITVYDYLSKFLEKDFFDDEHLKQYSPQITLWKIVFFFLFLLVLVFLLNLIRTVFKYYELRIAKSTNSLLVSYGLYAKKNTLLNPKKSQIVSYSQNYLQKQFDVLTIRIKQASSDEPSQNDKQNRSSSILIPGTNQAECSKLLTFIFKKELTQGKEFRPNYRYILKRLYLVILLPLAALILIGLYVNPEVQLFFPIIGIYVPIVLGLIYLGFRNYRLYVNDAFIIKKSGIWDIQHQIIEPHKIQAITSKQYFWQVAPNISSISIHTAAGTLSFSFVDFQEITKTINYWLYQVESSDKNWM